MNAETARDIIAPEAVPEDHLTRKARKYIDREMARRKETGEILMLSNDELDMVRELRRFREYCKPGAVFTWQTTNLSAAQEALQGAIGA